MDPVPERPISANPGLKFCPTFSISPAFKAAFNHYHFVSNPLSNGHVPISRNHCQVENRRNRKSDRQPVLDNRLLVSYQILTEDLNDSR